MNHYFNNIDIPFSIGGCNFHAVNIISSSIDTDIPLHTHGVNCYEIHFISNGCGRLIADGNGYDISTNTLYVTGPLCDHAQLTDKTSPMYEWCIYLRAEQNNSERSDILIDQFLSHNFWIGKDDQNILPIFERLFSELKSKSAGYANMAKLILSEIVVSVARNYFDSPAETALSSSDIYERSSLIIEEYFLYEYSSANLNELSHRLGLSTRQTQRLIEKNYGSTFSEKKEQARMSAARLLLSDDSLSLSEISERLGFSSQEYFSSSFKKFYGISPSHFKNIKL